MENCNCREIIANFKLEEEQHTTATFSIENNTVDATFSIQDAVIADKYFVFEQAESKDEWEINHNLNKKPSVTVVDEYDRVVIPAVEYVTDNKIIVRFNFAFKGRAYLN